jgi:hypothetical protein
MLLVQNDAPAAGKISAGLKILRYGLLHPGLPGRFRQRGNSLSEDTPESFFPFFPGRIEVELSGELEEIRFRGKHFPVPGIQEPGLAHKPPEGIIRKELMKKTERPSDGISTGIR